MTLETEQKDIGFYGKMLTFSRIKLNTDDFELINAALESVSPEKDSLIPVIIDSSIEIDLKRLMNVLWHWGLQPIGVVKGKLDVQAKMLRVPLFPPDGNRIERVTIKPNVVITPPEPDPIDDQHVDSIDDPQTEIDEDEDVIDTEINFEEIDALIKPKFNPKTADLTANIDIDDSMTSKVTSVVHNQLLRSGQSVNHVGGDLVLTNSVNDGAEAITDNNLHVYGKGMGRLVAGATGDPNTHIFCQKFNPSLVSVSGTYMLRDSIPKEFIDKAVQVSYKEDQGLVFRIMEDSAEHTTNNISNINNIINDR